MCMCMYTQIYVYDISDDGHRSSPVISFNRQRVKLVKANARGGGQLVTTNVALYAHSCCAIIHINACSCSLPLLVDSYTFSHAPLYLYILHACHLMLQGR